jgi:hypothetical protein
MSSTPGSAQILLQYDTITGNEHLANHPISCFSDSFQDCPDTARSTGGYIIFTQGAVADAKSMMPPLVAAVACFYVRMVFNEFHGFDPDQQLTIPIGIDSQSAIVTANSFRDTQRTRHIARRYHFVRLAIATSEIILFRVAGTNNWANSLTKPLNKSQLALESEIYQVEIEP